MEVTGIGHELGCNCCTSNITNYLQGKDGELIIKRKCADGEKAFKGWWKRNEGKKLEEQEDLFCCCPEDDSIGAKYLLDNA